jgi:hypothetical protein
MQQTESGQQIRIVPAPVLLRSKVLFVLGWSLLILSLALLSFHMLWMWKRMGTGAPLVAVGLLMDALVGIGMIVAGARMRRRQ